MPVSAYPQPVWVPDNSGQPSLIAQRQLPSRAHSGRLVFVENGASGLFPGMWNDQTGSASLDHDVVFNGMPAVRLDAQGQTTTSSTNSFSGTLTTGSTTTAITAASSATLILTFGGATTVDTQGYVVLTGLASGGPTSDNNTYVLAYTGVTNNGTTVVTLTGVSLYAISGTPSASVTLANIGTATATVNAPSPNPSNSPITTGVVYKRRLVDNYTSRTGHGVWFRPTSVSSAGNTGTSIFSLSHYNRDGVNQIASRLFLQQAIGMFGLQSGAQQDNALAWYLVPTGRGTITWIYRPLCFLTKESWSQHTWQPDAGKWDRTGAWHFAKIMVDWAAQQYIGIQIDDLNFPLSDPLYTLASTGAKMLHFSIELAQTTATRRFWHIGQVEGTVYE